MSKFVASICIENKINGHYVEPYAGGASVALHLLINKYVTEITINDKDRSIYAFWHSVLFKTNKLCKLIEEIDIDVETWKRLKEIQKNKAEANLLDLGFSTFFLNRTNHSGIIDGGIIGGLNQQGKYKIDCRFNKSDLIKRIKLIASHGDGINLSNLDAIDLIKNLQKNLDNNTIFYFDPPYLLKGPSLYLNHYKAADHKKVADEIRKIEKAQWIVSYDSNSEIEKLYSSFRTQEYSLLHTARTVRNGKEALFFSKKLRVENSLKLL